MNNLLRIYFYLPNDYRLGLLTKALNRIVAEIIKRILDSTVPRYFLNTQHLFPQGLSTEKKDKEIVVSFTSFPGRIKDVWIVVECLFRQTYKADKIILWLDENRFDVSRLPVNLKNQMSRGLEVRFVEDLRSHTKYFYALSEFKNSFVITVDDDCYYPNNLIENLIEINKEFPQAIASNRVHKMTYDGESLNPYSKWHHNYTPKHSIIGKYLLTGVGGVLYPPDIFDQIFFDKSVFLDKCKYADDVWLSLNAFRLGINIASNPTFNKDLIAISKTWNTRLLNYNSKGNGNDAQINSVAEHLKLNLKKQDNNKVYD